MEESQYMKQKMEAYLKAKFPQREELSVVEVERMPVGISYETYLFTTSWKEGGSPVSESLVIRMEPEYGPVPPYDVRPQYEALKAVHGSGVPVPKVHWLEMDSTVLGRPFFVMDKVDGDALYGVFSREMENREQLTNDYVSILARLHQLDWQNLGISILSVPEHDRQYAENEIARWQQVMEDNQYSPQPVMAEIICWLKRNIPPAERTTLCHGDYHSRNFLARDGRITGVLDWEMVGIGDPVSDLGWQCMFMRVLRENLWWPEPDFIRSYEEMCGAKVNEESLFFWKILSFVKLVAIGQAGVKTALESKDLDMRQLGIWTMLLPLLQEAPARMLGI